MDIDSLQPLIPWYLEAQETDEDLDSQDDTCWLQEEEDEELEDQDQDSPEETSWSHKDEKRDEEFDGVTIAGMPIPLIIDFLSGHWPPD